MPIPRANPWMLAIALGALACLAVACEGLIGADFNRTGNASDAAADAGAQGDAPSTNAIDSGPLFTVVQALPEGETLLGIWGADAEDVYAAGTNGLHCDYFAGSWHCAQDVTGRDYYGVWGRSATEAYAVGASTTDGTGIIQAYNGQGWTDEFIAPTPLYGVWGVGGIIFACGGSGQIYQKAVGTTKWTHTIALPANPNIDAGSDEPDLWAITGNNANNWAMPADQDRIFHYEGGGSFVNLDPVPDRSLVFVSAWGPKSSQTSVFFGTNYLGVTWLTASPPPAGQQLLADGMFVIFQDREKPDSKDLFIRGIWGSGTHVVFVGDLGTIYTLDLGSNDLVTLPSPVGDSFGGVWGSSLDDIWIVGERQLILHGTIPH